MPQPVAAAFFNLLKTLSLRASPQTGTAISFDLPKVLYSSGWRSATASSE